MKKTLFLKRYFINFGNYERKIKLVTTAINTIDYFPNQLKSTFKNVVKSFGKISPC